MNRQDVLSELPGGLTYNKAVIKFLTKIPQHSHDDVLDSAGAVEWKGAPSYNVKNVSVPEFIELALFRFAKQKMILRAQSAETPILLNELWGSSFLAPLIEITIPAYATVNVINLQEETKPHMRALRIHLEKEAQVNIWNIVLGTPFSAQTTEICFEGRDAKAKNHTVYFGKDKNHIEHFVRHSHIAEGGKSEITSRGILTDSSYARYDGMIDIRQTGAQSNATLDEQTLLLSGDAKIEAVPGLEIGTNDVQAAHSAGVTRIDEDQLFYAAARGIPEEEAIRLIAEGFLGKTLYSLPSKILLKKAQDRIRTYLCR
jgi:Fe-S cluster assembly scaffold protein SufB